MPSLDMPDEYLLEIGRISVRFNRIESLIRFAVWSLSGVAEDRMTVITRGDGFAQLADKFKALLEIDVTDEELRKALLEWLGKARRANDMRIDAIHSSWLKAPGGDDAMLVRVTRSGWAGGFMSPQRARLLADYIEAVADRGLELFERLRPDLFTTDEDDQAVPDSTDTALPRGTGEEAGS